MIFDFELKMDALDRLIAQARRTHARQQAGDGKDQSGLWVDVLVGIKEDLLRSHHYREIAIEHEAAPIPKNKGGRPRTRNPITAGALN